MEILIGLFVGLIILGILVAIYDWVRFGMPIWKRRRKKRKASRQGLDEPAKSTRSDQEQENP
jgi:uncharacterized protein (DUF2062 family)